MFKNEFQGGAFFEVFSAQGKDPTSMWKLTGGSGIRKIYDKEVKSYIYTLEGSGATTKMQLPKDAKQSLTLIQRFCVLQIHVPLGADFSVELGIMDLSNNKRRLMFSTAVKDIHVTPLHAKIPLIVIRRSIWLNLCLDLVSFVSDTWRNQTYKCIENVTISANCRLRRIFTMKVQPPDTTNDDEIFGLSTSTNSCEVEPIPRQCQMATDVQQLNQVLTVAKVKHLERRVKSGDASSRPTSSSESDLNSSGRKSSDGRFHIAFGSKIRTPASSHQRKGTASKEGSLNSSRGRSSYTRSKEDQNDTKRVDKLVVTSPTNNSRVTSDSGIGTDETDHTNKDSLGGSQRWAGDSNQKDDVLFSAGLSGRRSQLNSKQHPRDPVSLPKPASARPPHVLSPRGNDTAGRGSMKAHQRPSPRQTARTTVPGVSPRGEDGPMSWGQNAVSPRGEEGEFKQPHPPNLPVEKKRRTVRIKSGGKERSQPVAGSHQRYESCSTSEGDEIVSPRQKESPRKLEPSPRNKEAELLPSVRERVYQPGKYGGQALGAEALNKSITKEMGVGPASPRYPESGDFKNDNQDESLSELISALQEKVDIDEQHLGEGDCSDGDDHPEEDGIYLFASPPKTAPRRSPVDRTRKSKKSLQFNQNASNNRGPRLSEDFLQKSISSDEDIRDRMLLHTPSPRLASNPVTFDPQTDGSPRNKNYTEVDSDMLLTHSVQQSSLRAQKSDLSPTSLKTKDESYFDLIDNQSGSSDKQSSSNPAFSRSKRGFEYQSSSQETSNGLNNFDLGYRTSGDLCTRSSGEDGASQFTMHVPKKDEYEFSPKASGRLDELRIPRGSESLNSSVRSSISVSRRSVREIPQHDARLSQPKNYDINRYRMEDLSESFEANMLASLKRQQDEEEEEAPAEGGNQNSHNTNDMQRHNFGDDVMSDSSDDTSFSTWRGPAPSLKAHHYQDEMYLPSSRLSHDPLTSSNPRDWNGAFSPPVVLASTIHKDPSDLSRGKLEAFTSPRKDGKNNTKSPDDHEGSDGEEELELLFDPCLNCYFDPKTCKYYELA